MSPGDRLWLHNGQAGEDCATLVERVTPTVIPDDSFGVEVWRVRYAREPEVVQVRGIVVGRSADRKCPDEARK